MYSPHNQKSWDKYMLKDLSKYKIHIVQWRQSVWRLFSARIESSFKSSAKGILWKSVSVPLKLWAEREALSQQSIVVQCSDTTHYCCSHTTHFHSDSLQCNAMHCLVCAVCNLQLKPSNQKILEMILIVRARQNVFTSIRFLWISMIIHNWTS